MHRLSSTYHVCPTAAKSKKPQASYPLSPAAPDAEEVSRFKFDTLSPDDAVLEAQKRATGSAEPSSVHQHHQRSWIAPQFTQNEATPSITDGELPVLPSEHTCMICCGGCHMLFIMSHVTIQCAIFLQQWLLSIHALDDMVCWLCQALSL